MFSGYVPTTEKPSTAGLPAGNGILLSPKDIYSPDYFMKIQRVVVIGAGAMGNGIAHVFAAKNYQVTMVDVSHEALERGMATILKNMDRQVVKGSLSEDDKKKALTHLKLHTDLQMAVAEADLVVEAATENEDLKKKIFRDLDAWAPANCILATNTSSISITRLAAVTQRPEKVIGMHFMNPVPVMKLVEIIDGFSTDAGISAAITDLSRKLDKIPYTVKDYPGFIANRILMPMINEAICALHEGVGGVEEIDQIMKLGMAHPMGPLQLADFIGLDVCLSILNVLYTGFGNPKYFPSPLLQNMVAAGHKGIKSGQGFYVYTPGSKDLVVAPPFVN
jgi:3-hydroxybutyryl-CoA dehydrogenase